MADPKYAGLPGIAEDQPDTYETCSDHELEMDEESDSEQSETLHLSSLSWIGDEFEIGGQAEKETMLQKYTRLRCEISDLAEDLNSLTESAREGNLVGLQSQVDQLQQQLEVCFLDQGDLSGSDPAQKNLDNLKKYIGDLSKVNADNSEQKKAAYDLYLKSDESVSAETLSILDEKLSRLEKIVGSNLSLGHKVLTVGTDNLCLVEATETLESRKQLLNSDHLGHVEGRLAALSSKLDAMKENRAQMNAANLSSDVTTVFDAIERRVAVATVLPNLLDRLQDLKELHQNSSDWSARFSEINANQEKTETLLSENAVCLTKTQQILAEGLEGVAAKFDKLQTSLQSLPV